MERKYQNMEWGDTPGLTQRVSARVTQIAKENEKKEGTVTNTMIQSKGTGGKGNPSGNL